MNFVSALRPMARSRTSYRRSLNNGDGLNDLLLVQLRTGAVQITDDRGHTGLVAHGGRQVDGLLRVILREAVRARKRAVRKWRRGRIERTS